MEYFNKIDGEKCYLSPINLDDVELYTKWLNDPEIIEYLTLRTKVISLHSEKEHLEKMSYEHNYGIVTKENNKLIGNCGFLELDHLNRIVK